MGEFITFLGNNLADFWTYTGFANATVGHVVMLLVGLFFIYLAVAKEFEPVFYQLICRNASLQVLFCLCFKWGGFATVIRALCERAPARIR